MTENMAAEDWVVQKFVNMCPDIDEMIKEFFRGLNEVLNSLSEEFAHLIQNQIKQAEEKIQQIQDKIKELRDKYYGHPDELRKTAEQWVASVGNPLGDVAANIDLGKLDANVEWEGRAAEAYKAIVPSQGEGLDSIKELAVQMRTSLHSLADAIRSFWLAVLFGLAYFVVGVAEALLTIWAGVTVPMSLVVVVAAASFTLPFISFAYKSYEEACSTIDTDVRTIQQKMHDLGAQWPKSKHDMSDGSVSDGDSSDWRINS